MLNDILFQIRLPIFFVIFIFLILPIFFIGAPFMPSFRKKTGYKHLLTIINFLKTDANLNGYGQKSRKFIDLGSGDGRVVIEFAKQGFESYGIELNPFLVLWSRWKIKRLGLKNAKIMWGNFWKINFSDFDVFYIFHFQIANNLLSKKLKQELKKNSVIISFGFILPGFQLIKKEGGFLAYKKAETE
jgi:SAM-dependent methyltransferase